MCEFCESITDRNKEIIWNVRSTYADNNICEFVNESNCEKCDSCEMYFHLDGYEYNDNIIVGIAYNQKIIATNGDIVIIRPFSESIQFNFCPICGKQISKEIKEWSKYYEHQISINDK